MLGTASLAIICRIRDNLRRYNKIKVPLELRPKYGRKVKVIDEALLDLLVYLEERLTALLDKIR